MEFVGIIPARYGSSRFPGKALAMLKDKPIIQWVYEKAVRSLNEVYVATDDEKIFQRVKDFGGNVVMTDPNHQSGTDRCREAMDAIITGLGIHVDVVVNIQGDEPFISPEQIEKLKSCFSQPGTEIATLVKKIDKKEDIFDENKPKVVLDSNNFALMFSRSPIPFIRGRNPEEWIIYHDFFRHIGIYAYQKDVLRRITGMKQSPLEIAESLEQLRWIENGIKIRAEFTDQESIGIDTPEDLRQAIAFMDRQAQK